MIATAKTKSPAKVGHVPLHQIGPSPENNQLYRPIESTDPEILLLVKSIKENGLLEPLIVTADGYIVSGHRRYRACILAGFDKVPVRRLAIRRTDDPDAFVRLLREHNRQREKTNAERLHEELVTLNPEDAHRELLEYRRERAIVGVEPLKVGHVRLRKSISRAKGPMLSAILEILEARRKFWPLADRVIHYALLNNPPRRHASKPGSTYRNDLRSYSDLCDLLTRARLSNVVLFNGDDPSFELFNDPRPAIPFEAIGDETRPVQVWDSHENVRSFMQQQLKDMFRGYWRDLMVSQPNHVEIVVEKNTVLPIIQPIAAEYTIPITSGRGYCSLAPRQAMAQRFEKSRKLQLILLVASDFDPEGEDIAHSFARSMRDDFAVDNIHPIKMALNADQVRGLPPGAEAKKSSSRYKKFVAKYGPNVYELEAVAPEKLQEIIRGTIESVIDRAAYSSEIEAEKVDAAFLEGVRRAAISALKDVDLGGDG